MNILKKLFGRPSKATRKEYDNDVVEQALKKYHTFVFELNEHGFPAPSEAQNKASLNAIYKHPDVYVNGTWSTKGNSFVFTPSC